MTTEQIVSAAIKDMTEYNAAHNSYLHCPSCGKVIRLNFWPVVNGMRSKTGAIKAHVDACGSLRRDAKDSRD